MVTRIKHAGPLSKYPQLFAEHRVNGHDWDRVETRRGGFRFDGAWRRTMWRRRHKCTCGMLRTVITDDSMNILSRWYDAPDGYALDGPWDMPTRLELRAIVWEREAEDDMRSGRTRVEDIGEKDEVAS